MSNPMKRPPAKALGLDGLAADALLHIRKRIRPPLPEPEAPPDRNDVNSELVMDDGLETDPDTIPPTTSEPEPFSQPATGRRSRDRSAANYAIGYKKPPKSGQFQPGQSGNPKGRPKHSRNVRTVMEEIYYRPTEIRRNGKIVRIPVFQVVMEQLARKAMEGDLKAAGSVKSDVFKLMGFDEASTGKAGLSTNAPSETSTTFTDSQRRMLAHLKRLQYLDLGFSEKDVSELLKLDFGLDLDDLCDSGAIVNADPNFSHTDDTDEDDPADHDGSGTGEAGNDAGDEEII